MTEQERWNVVARNAAGKVIAGTANVRSQKAAGLIADAYMTDGNVDSVSVTPFIAVNKNGNGRWR